MEQFMGRFVVLVRILSVREGRSRLADPVSCTLGIPVEDGRHRGGERFWPNQHCVSTRTRNGQKWCEPMSAENPYRT